MYPNLKAEMARQGLTQKVIAARLGWTSAKASRKFSGKSQFTWSECKQILEVLGGGLSADYVFGE